MRIIVMEYPPCLEINPDGPANGTVIWLHGLGADGNDFVPIIPELRLPGTTSTAWTCCRR
ncbi:hypothetical protein [Thiolapillus sp.]|uniref:hypothetical protein n=1 Tax=Thiolapillus sp. TaxID=2017437 RepID=UPI003AF76F72